MTDEELSINARLVTVRLAIRKADTNEVKGDGWVPSPESIVAELQRAIRGWETDDGWQFASVYTATMGAASSPLTEEEHAQVAEGYLDSLVREQTADLETIKREARADAIVAAAKLYSGAGTPAMAPALAVAKHFERYIMGEEEVEA